MKIDSSLYEKLFLAKRTRPDDKPFKENKVTAVNSQQAIPANKVLPIAAITAQKSEPLNKPTQNEHPQSNYSLSQIKSRMDSILKRRASLSEGYLHKIEKKKALPRMVRDNLKRRLLSATEKTNALLMPAINRLKENKIIKDIFPKLKPKKIEQIDIGRIFRKQVESGTAKPTASERKRKLVDQMEKAGLELEPAKVPKIIMAGASALTGIITIIWLIISISKGDSAGHIVFIMLLIWTLGLFLIWVFSWICFLAYLDIRKFNRKLAIEEVLPDYLQLTSANIRAGMPIDRALWFAVRPKFGVLAKEIEDVAKRTLSGEDLNKALIDFSKKYDSPTLQRSINLLIEGTEAGGDVGELLNKIAQNINELKSMKREMGANVMTYVIFITFASILAAPVLFALSEQLLAIVQNISTGVSASGGMPKGGMLTINLGTDNIKASDFRIFIFSSLSISSFFSAIIVSTIRKGDVKEGLHYIPIFIAVSIGIFLIASWVMGLVFSGMFSP